MWSGTRLTFRGITRAIFARLRKKATANGISVDCPAGEAVKDGARIQWKYDPDAELLEVECVHAPFWIDRARINQRLSQEIEATVRADRAA
ncbi:hypothetical protein H7849_07250 [Alloacidobacterium dinghuense]|uniref:Uncharacterized protein n=1 Tax=Alloacidobacterium dinghuense TaxID=2763107 RepID=A0A7G8BME1_9BACT|nr:hypothetical protein [Alloacidobacterium dinghuense]QNI33711.1 hypothetical protein H7849_07250 [Alloacidobacterium dinghuense]